MRRMPEAQVRVEIGSRAEKKWSTYLEVLVPLLLAVLLLVPTSSYGVIRNFDTKHEAICEVLLLRIRYLVVLLRAATNGLG